MRVIEALSAPTFQHAVLLYPIATALHVYDEWPEFPRWARRFASPAYSDREYVRTHAATVLLAIAGAVLLWAAASPWLVFLFFAFLFGPGVFCNALFHSAASLRTRSHCPGVRSSVLLYLPLAGWLAWLAVRDRWLTPRQLLLALVIAALGHVAEVGHTVFKRW
ncbi:MAG TPA: HXXEE domain-containing protein [Candidatus Dormibacteraeota bacterium]|nr:HXXEE domain-containing protein [Candidatus Dormibacteraeota bacterium]